MYRMGISISYYPDNQWKQKSDSTDIERIGVGWPQWHCPNDPWAAYIINIREYRRVNQKWTIQRNWKQDEEKQNTTHYVLDTTIRKQRLIT